LRRALKFKAYVFLLAWLTFFAHNVIPHNHANENYETNRNLVHNSAKADREHSEEQVCHLSNFLFHTLSPEVLLACSDRDINFIPDLYCAEFYIDNDHSNNSDHLRGISYLRAPPAL
jgi:hypothetical protein